MTHHRRSNGVPSHPPSLNVAIVGGGLVGSLCASFLAKRGHHVTVYEYREDIRNAPLMQGKSINLAMSVRARTALREIGLEEEIVEKHGIPMQGRMIHPVHGKNYVIPYDAINKQCIFSVGRKYLNETLLTTAESHPNVKTVFNHKLASANLEDGIMKFQNTETKREVIEKADLIIGADGAYSAVRKEMLKQPLFDFSQKYIPHGYLELCIPPTKNGEFAMEPNFLHIWPRGSFMMIALPNQDKTWTVTLFMPFENFHKLTTPGGLLQFFETNFPDSIPLIGKEKLIADFFAAKPSPLVSIKCNPYHVSNKCLIIGDAAHAMVPFYGQGMNAGFEDCFILDKLMDQFNSDLSKVLPEFSKFRNPDAEAICDLAMYNYVEMRDLVNRKTFLLRKKLDNILFRMLPNLWVPLYNSVTFSTMHYSHCIKNRGFQDKVIDRSLIVVSAFVVLLLAFFLFSNIPLLL